MALRNNGVELDIGAIFCVQTHIECLFWGVASTQPLRIATGVVAHKMAPRDVQRQLLSFWQLS